MGKIAYWRDQEVALPNNWSLEIYAEHFHYIFISATQEYKQEYISNKTWKKVKII